MAVRKLRRKPLVDLSQAEMETGVSKKILRRLGHQGAFHITQFERGGKWHLDLDEVWTAVESHTFRKRPY